MKIFGIVTASLAALLLGANLVLAAFAPVLPPDFDRTWDEEFAVAHWAATWHSQQQALYYVENARYAATVEELYAGIEWYRNWKDRDEAGWRRAVREQAEEIRIVASSAESVTATYYARELVPDELNPDRVRRGGLGPTTCTVTLDADYAQRFASWYANPGARAATTLPPDLDVWPYMDCRRTAGLRGGFAWAGFDRFRRPPPERYSQLSYAEKAWQRGEAGPPGGLP
jgi:hypothetical protein